MDSSSLKQTDILLIEDNPDDEELALIAMRSWKTASQVTVIRDGAEALDYVLAKGKHSGRSARRKPQLVLLDLKLPKIGGLEVLKALRSNADTMYIPVVVLTTSSQDEDISACYRSGANSYVRKPVEFDKFVKAIQQLESYWLTWNEVPQNA